MEALLDTAGVPRYTVPVEGTLRMNVAVVEPDGTTTKLNEPGPTLTGDDDDALIDGTLAAVDATPPWVVGCGSLPPGAPVDLYATLVRRAREHGVRVAIDSSEAPLAAAVAARPQLIKPNHEELTMFGKGEKDNLSKAERKELAELVGTPMTTLRDVRDAAAALVADGIERVVVSLGGDGALLVDATGCTHAIATIDDPLSTVGAGDCLLAGLLDALSRDQDAATALIAGVTWGAAAVRLPGSRVPSSADCEDIVVICTADPDLDRLLH